MNDLDLLSQFAQQGSQEAFSLLVTRHLDLVYTAARRQVGSPDLAKEVAQTVFLDLAETAHKIQPGTQLSSWLYVASRRRAIDVVRREASRRRREGEAVEAATMKASPSTWADLEPMLDEAMASLDEKDRMAVLLRFFENKGLDEVGRALGASEDAAQKRVSRAVERLHAYFAKRGIVTAAAALAANLSAHAVQSAPVGLSGTIVSSIAAKSAVGLAVAHQAGKAFITVIWPKAVFALVMTVVVGFVGYQVYRLQEQRQEIANLQNVLNAKRQDLSRLKSEIDQTKASAPALLSALSSRDAEFDARIKTVMARLSLVKKRFRENPDQQIPELKFLSESDWFGVIQEKAKWGAEEDIQEALSSVRTRAKNRFLPMLQEALKKYLEVSHGQLPIQVTQLSSYFDPSVDYMLLNRYQMMATGSVSKYQGREDLIGEMASSVINPKYDNLGRVSIAGCAVVHAGNVAQAPEQKALVVAINEALVGYRAAHEGKDPDFYWNNPELLAPYFKNAELAESFVQMQKASMNLLGFSRPNAWGEAQNVYRVAHHGTYAANPEDLVPYFQDPNDAAKFLLAIKDGRLRLK